MTDSEINKLWCDCGGYHKQFARAIESRLLAERADAEKDAALMRIAHELRTYNPAADEYKGVHIHNGWASKIEDLLAAADREALIDRVTLEVKEARS